MAAWQDLLRQPEPVMDLFLMEVAADVAATPEDIHAAGLQFDAFALALLRAGHVCVALLC